MALLVTLVEVLAMIGGMALLLWFTAYIETRQLGPAGSTDSASAGEADSRDGAELAAGSMRSAA